MENKPKYLQTLHCSWKYYNNKLQNKISNCFVSDTLCLYSPCLPFHDCEYHGDNSYSCTENSDAGQITGEKGKKKTHAKLYFIWNSG